MNARAGLLSVAKFFGVAAGVGFFALSGVLLVGVCASTALAETPAAFFNYSSVIGSNKVITATQVPIQPSTGPLIYKDVTIQINVDAAGNLTYATTAPLATLSPMLSASTFRAGIYTDSSDSRFGIQVSGPSLVPGGGGLAQWSLTSAPGLGCDPPQPATFYTGPLASSPLAGRVKDAGITGITATQYSFGLIGTAGCGNGNWQNNGLIGLTNVGGNLVIASFTQTGKDASSPYTQIIYVLQK
jgi:hypothetical protein